MPERDRDKPPTEESGGVGHGPRSPSQPSASERRSEPTPDPSEAQPEALPDARAEEPDGDRSEASPPEPEERGDDPVAQLRAERDEYLDLAQRARAELENYRKRTTGELTAAERRGREAVAREVLPALDNLERALLAAGVKAEPGVPEEEAPRSEEVRATDAFAQGVALVFRELRAAIGRAGITELDPTGQRFDPNRHEAVAKHALDGAESGTVIETIQRGYLLGDHAIRPARVIVAE